MIRSLLKIAVFLVIAVLAYNYFLGNPEEKAQSRELVGKAADLGKDAWNLLRAEKEKLAEGKYDGALDKLQGLYGELRETATRLKDSEALARLRELEATREDISRQLENGVDDNDKKKAGEALDQLTEDTEELMNKLEKGQ